MTVVLTDQEMDRAEAFRLAKRFRLPDEIALSDDPELIRLRTFCELNRIDDTPIMTRIMAMKLKASMQRTISDSSASYADRLSHIVDIDDPVSFVDLRDVVPSDPPPSPAYHHPIPMTRGPPSGGP